MIYAFAVLISIILFLPFTLRVRALVNLKELKLYFAINIYGVIRLSSGYIGFANNRLVLRYGKNKQTPLKYKDILLDGNKVDLINHFDLVKISSAILLGADELSIWFAFILRVLNPTVNKLLKIKSCNLRFKNDIYIIEENTAIGGILEIVAVSNIFAITEMFVKKFIGEILVYVKDKKR